MPRQRRPTSPPTGVPATITGCLRFGAVDHECRGLMKGCPGEQAGEAREEQCQRVVTKLQPPNRKVLFDVEHRLQRQARTPEDREVAADATCQGRACGEFARVEYAHKPVRDDPEDDITAVDP